MITEAQVWELLDAFEQAARLAAGRRSEGTGVEGQVLFDIDREADGVRTGDHGGWATPNLRTMVEFGEEPRLWATFIAGERQLTERGDRCQAWWSDKYHCVMVYDYKSEQHASACGPKKPDMASSLTRSGS